MNLEKYIINLLQQHDCVIVPGFGGFIANYEPANIQAATHTILPPQKYLLFNSNLTVNDGLLATEICSRQGCSFEEAMQLIALEVASWQEDIKAGKAITLNGVGSFNLNKSRKLEFKPELDQNFFDEAYGLTPLVVPPLKKSARKPKFKDINYHKPARIIQTRVIRRMAWAAAITIPLVAAGTWSVMNYDSLRQFAIQHSGFVFSLQTKPGDLSEKAINLDSKILSPAEEPEIKTNNILTDTFNFTNDQIKETELADQNETALQSPEEALPVPSGKTDFEPTSASDRTYHIIIGSFENLINAQLLTEELNASGWNASVVGTSQGMYRVSIASCNTKQQALRQLQKIREERNPNAWLLKI